MDNTSTAGSDEVKWQVAFFTLLPLALTAMTQPVGRVLDTAPGCGFWIRGSPIFAAGDVVYFLGRVTVNYFVEPTLSWKHLRAELAHRFRDEDWTRKPPEVGNAVLGRWMLMLLGSLPCQTIKIVAMRGIPVTQALAGLYLTAIVFGEVVNISAEALFRRRGLVAVPIPSMELPSDRKPIATHLILTACIVAQYTVTWGGLHTRLWIPGEDVPLYSSTMWILTLPLMIIPIYTQLDSWPPVSFMNEKMARDYVTATFTICIYYPAIMYSVRFAYRVSPPALPAQLLLAVGCGTACLLALGFLSHMVDPLLSWMRRMFARLGETWFGRVLGIPATDAERIHLCVFVFNIAMAVLEYVYLFDSSGTVNPTWAGIFGYNLSVLCP